MRVPPSGVRRPIPAGSSSPARAPRTGHPSLATGHLGADNGRRSVDRHDDVQAVPARVGQAGGFVNSSGYEGDTARHWSVETAAPVVFVAAVALALSVLFAGRLMTASDGGGHHDGAIFDRRGLVVYPPDPQATPLRPRMVVVAIDGFAVNDLLRGKASVSTASVGDVLDYRVNDNGVSRV